MVIQTTAGSNVKWITGKQKPLAGINKSMDTLPTVLDTIRSLVSRERKRLPVPGNRCHVGFVGNVPEPCGGAELFLQNLISQLSEFPVSVALVRWQKQIMHYDGSVVELVYRERETVERDEDSGAKIHYLIRPTPGWLIVKLVMIFRLAAKATGFFHRENVQVIHCHLLAPNIYYSFIASRLLRVPLVITIHGLVDVDEPGHILHQRYKKLEKRLIIWILKKCDRVITVSREITERCAALGIPHLDTKSCGIDTRYFQPADSEERGILFIGNLTEGKGFKLLLQAYDRVRNSINEPLYLAGKNPTKYDFNNDPDIVHLGLLSQADLRQAIQASKLVVLPSRSEGMPLSVLEAMSCNKPVLVTPVGELAHLIVDGENGFLCDTDSVDSLARRIEEILDNDSGLSGSLGDKPRVSVREYDIRNIAHWHWRLYRSLVASASDQTQSV
jgi:glycosyltransferase involved in cell wall biosynthesis